MKNQKCQNWANDAKQIYKILKIPYFEINLVMDYLMQKKILKNTVFLVFTVF